MKGETAHMGKISTNQFQDLLKKLDKLDERLDRIEQDMAVTKAQIQVLREEIAKVDATYERQLKDLKTRLWSILTIYITATGGFLIWIMQESIRQ